MITQLRQLATCVVISLLTCAVSHPAGARAASDDPTEAAAAVHEAVLRSIVRDRCQAMLCLVSIERR